MENKYLIVVDMQNDFVTGSLGTQKAQQIVPTVVQKVQDFNGIVVFTKDTHETAYLSTQEGKLLPVEHCLRETNGWQLIEQFAQIQQQNGWKIYEKGTFGCLELAEQLLKEHNARPIQSIELVGLCTDICVVSNALLLKAYLPEVPIFVDAACCAGVTPEKHEMALETMGSCQIQIRNWK